MISPANKVPGGAHPEQPVAGGGGARGAGARVHRAPPGQARPAPALGALRGGQQQHCPRRRHLGQDREDLPQFGADTV